MFHKILILVIMGVPLAGAVAVKTAPPVLFVMGCLVLLAISVAKGNDKQA